MSVRSWGLALSVAAVTALATSALAVVSSGAAPPAAAPHTSATWGPVKVLDENPAGESIAVDGASTTTVVWSSAYYRGQVTAVSRPAGGAWSAPEVIGRGIDPRVAADEAGDLTVVWLSQRRGHADGVLVAQRPAGGDWTDPVRLTPDVSLPGYVPGGGTAQGAAHAAVDVTPAGAVVVAWDWALRNRDDAARVQSSYRPAGGEWTGPVDVTAATGANSPQVGIADDGSVVLLYARQALGHPQVLKSRVRTVAGDWTAPATVAAAGYSPQLAVDAAGDAIVAYSPNFNRVEGVRMSAGGAWGRARELTPRGVMVRGSALAINDEGSAVFAYGRNRGRVVLLRRPPQGPWSSPARVVSGGPAASYVVAGLDDAGDTFVGWGLYALLGRYRPHGAGWDATSTISPDAGVEVLESLFAEIAPNGDVTVLWKQEERPLKVRVLSAS